MLGRIQSMLLLLRFGAIRVNFVKDPHMETFYLSSEICESSPQLYRRRPSPVSEYYKIYHDMLVHELYCSSKNTSPNWQDGIVTTWMDLVLRVSSSSWS